MIGKISTKKPLLIAASLTVLLLPACGRYVDNSAEAGNNAPTISIPPNSPQTIPGQLPTNTLPSTQPVITTPRTAVPQTQVQTTVNPNLPGAKVTSANTVVVPSTVITAPRQQAATVPQTQPQPQLQSQGTVHIVKSGDTLSVIAERYGLGLSVLVKYNNISDEDTLKLDQEIKIPPR